MTNELFPTRAARTGNHAATRLQDQSDAGRPLESGVSGRRGEQRRNGVRGIHAHARATNSGTAHRRNDARPLVFSNIGCALCHTPTMTTAQSSEAAALSNVPANLYSDLLVHNMGVGLADGVSQGGANGQQFRSAPLWGVGQRVFFLHDGRTSEPRASHRRT